MFRLYVAWAARETNVRVFAVCDAKGRPERHVGPLCMTAEEAANSAIRLGLLPRKPTDAQRDAAWRRFRNDQEYIVKVSVNYAVWLVANARDANRRPVPWSSWDGPMAHCGTRWEETTRIKYLPQIMHRHALLWGQPMPLTIAPDRE